MKTIYTAQIYTPIKIIITDEVLSRIAYLQEKACNIKLRKDEYIHFTMSLGKYEDETFDKTKNVIAIIDNFDNTINEVNDIVDVNIYNDYINITTPGEEGVDILVDTNILTMPDVWFSTDIIRHLIDIEEHIKYGRNALNHFRNNYIDKEHTKVMNESILRYKNKFIYPFKKEKGS